jgi:hypothetical protein
VDAQNDVHKIGGVGQVEQRREYDGTTSDEHDPSLQRITSALNV